MSDIFAAEAGPGLGHNEPPKVLKTGKELDQHLEETYAANVARARELMAAAPRYLFITNDAEDNAATEFLVKVRACFGTAESCRKLEKGPYDEAGGQVQAFFKTEILDPLGLPPSDKRGFDPAVRDDLGWGPRITMAQTIYKTKKLEEERRIREAEAQKAREEEERRRREAYEAEQKAREAERAASRKRNEEARAAAEAEAARLRAEAEERRKAEEKAAQERAAAESAANAQAADMTRSRGARGGVSSLREYVDYRDLDRDTIDLEKLRPYITEEMIEKALRAYIRSNESTVDKAARGTAPQPIRGVTFHITHRAAGRA